MKAATTINEMMAGNKIIVPDYQRAYSWDTPAKNESKKTHQTNVFLSDLEEHKRSKSKSPNYFGHFLFEEKCIENEKKKFYVIDGQQRLTSIVIFLSALFSRLKKIRNLNEKEEIYFKDMIKRSSTSTVCFATVDYDNQFFKDYVIDQKITNSSNLETESSRRIARAFDYFKKHLSEKPEDYLVQMLDIIRKAACTTHQIQNESEAVQMFIFQNNRGKSPTNMEIIKAQFMHAVHLYGKEKTDSIISEIKNRFEKIYKSISSIEYHINEDNVLNYSLMVYFNSLKGSNSLEKINQCLTKSDRIDFIKSFTQTLSSSFDYLETFFKKDERENFAIHSLISLGGIAIALPFIIKAYSYNIGMENIKKLCSALESLVLRHRLIGTRAILTSRINDDFQGFKKENPNIEPIIERITWMKTTTGWWKYWNNDNLRESLQGVIKHPVAKYLLWKYEIHLEGQGKSGYKPSRFDDIERPELEHIAPKTEPPVKSHGYDKYDEKFKNEYLDCLGNYLLLSKSHNCAVGNIPFKEKIATYNHNEQQREVHELGNTHVSLEEEVNSRKERTDYQVHFRYVLEPAYSLIIQLNNILI